MRRTRPSLRLDIPGQLFGLVLSLATLVGLGTSVPISAQSPMLSGQPDIVVTYSVLGSVVQDLVGDRATVTVLMPNGVDPHDWSPSARDIETLHHADLVIANGLGLEATIDDVLDEVAANGTPVFRATDHILVRALDDTGDHAASPSTDGHGLGVLDPHFWVDALSMRDVVTALVPVLASVGVDVSDRAPDLTSRLEALDAEVRTILGVIPPERRQLVTGHESMGYFAARYGFQLIGAVIPGLSSLGEVSANQLAAISGLIRDHDVPAIFTEIGTPQAVVDAIASETGVQVVPLPSHNLPADGSYATFIRDIATAIAGALG
jgi:zinc/manganese transport system substrate-binding protein